MGTPTSVVLHTTQLDKEQSLATIMPRTPPLQALNRLQSLLVNGTVVSPTPPSKMNLVVQNLPLA